MLLSKNVKYTYPGGKTFLFPDIELSKGEQLVLLGKSGSGKSTLIHILAGLIQASEGTVFLNKTNISILKPTAMDKFRGKNIGLIFQKPLFINSISMLENIVIAQSMPGIKVDKTFSTLLLQKLDIQHLSNQKPTECSEGELQRFSIARALVNKPQIVLADEPTASLDDENCNRFITLLQETCTLYKTALFVATHDQRIKQHISKSYQI